MRIKNKYKNNIYIISTMVSVDVKHHVYLLTFIMSVFYSPPPPPPIQTALRSKISFNLIRIKKKKYIK